MQDSFDPLTIIFMILAVFIIWKLRSVLGQRTGSERKPTDPFSRREDRPANPANESGNGSGADNVIRLPGAGQAADNSPAVVTGRWEGIAEKGSPVAAGLDAIVAAEPQFDAHQFQDGARAAYEAIVAAFSRGDRVTLKGLLAADVYQGFEEALSNRDSKGERAETTFVSIANPEIMSAEVVGRIAQVTVSISSKLISATRNAAGEVVEGDPEAVVDITDVWTFSRTLGSKDPNWLLMATGADA